MSWLQLNFCHAALPLRSCTQIQTRDLPTGTSGKRHRQRARSLSEAPALRPGRNMIGIGFRAEAPDIVCDP